MWIVPFASGQEVHGDAAAMATTMRITKIPPPAGNRAVVAADEDDRRQLQPMTTSVTDFCLDRMPMIEAHHSGRFYRLFDSAATMTVSTEMGGYECGCTYDGAVLRVICDLLFSFDGVTFHTQREVLDFTSFASEDGLDVFRPSRTGWVRREGDVSFRELFGFDTATDLQLQSCNVDYGVACDLGQPDCRVCEDGQSVATVGECTEPSPVNVTCDEDYQGAFFNSYLFDNDIVSLAQDDESNGSLNCDGADATATWDDFCGNLTAVETDFTDNLLFTVINFDLGSINQPFQCACSDTQDNFTVECAAAYTDTSGVEHSSVETMQFELDGGYLVMRSVQWCDTASGGEPLCEEYKFCIGQDALCSCTIDGCDADYCELCSNGVSVGHMCVEDTTPVVCDDLQVGALAFTLKDMRLVSPACESASPTASPTDRPANISPNGPTTKMSPVTETPTMNPTTPSSKSGRVTTPILGPLVVVLAVKLLL